MPSLDLTGNFYQNGMPNQSLLTLKTREALVGVAMNIPLFDGFGRTYKVRGAQATIEHREAVQAILLPTPDQAGVGLHQVQNPVTILRYG